MRRSRWTRLRGRRPGHPLGRNVWRASRLPSKSHEDGNAPRSDAGWVRREIDCTAGWSSAGRSWRWHCRSLAIRRSTDERRAQTRGASKRVRGLLELRAGVERETLFSWQLLRAGHRPSAGHRPHERARPRGNSEADRSPSPCRTNRARLAARAGELVARGARRHRDRPGLSRPTRARARSRRRGSSGDRRAAWHPRSSGSPA